MNYGATAGGMAAYAAVIQAVKASGAIVRVDPDSFPRMVGKNEHPVVVAEEKFFKTTYKYLTSYGGFVFFTKSSTPLTISGRAEVVAARKIRVPR